MNTRKGAKLISMLLAFCLFTLGFGMSVSASAKGSPQHKRSSEMSKKKEAKYAGGKMTRHYKKAR
jgi:hypothetical protein